MNKIGIENIRIEPEKIIITVSNDINGTFIELLK
jgi:hypothetical protein